MLEFRHAVERAGKDEFNKGLAAASAAAEIIAAARAVAAASIEADREFSDWLAERNGFELAVLFLKLHDDSSQR